MASNIAGEDELDFDVNIQGNTNILTVYHLTYMICQSKLKRFDLFYFKSFFFSVDNNIN